VQRLTLTRLPALAGSDEPVVTANPLEGIEVALTQREVGAVSSSIFNGEQSVNRSCLIES
jgi:predicted amidohydrolase YtcJ